MEAAMLVENLDALWFFTNVLSFSESKKQTLANDDTQKPAKTEESTKPPSPNVEKLLKKSQISENSFQKGPKCEEIAVETEQIQPPADTEVFSEDKQNTGEEKKKKKKQRERRMRGKQSLRMGFDHGNPDYYGSSLFFKRKCGSQKFGSLQHDLFMEMILPPFDDSMAMKEQLRTWAHAVACSVRDSFISPQGNLSSM